MKKVKLLIVSLIAIFAFNINVNAASGSLSVSSSNVYVGNTFTVTANVNSAAAWNIHVSASGPVSGCTINQADATADAMDTNKSFRATCTATGTGTITVTLTGDVTSASDGNAVIVSGSRNITVSQKPAAPSNNNNNNNNNNNTNNNNNNNNNYNNNNNNNQETDKKSKNNSIKELSVEGHKLNKVNNNSYTLSVPNDVNTINIKATAEDSKAKVTGAGKHDIKVGDNNIEIIVTAENGSQNKINIKVTRKDGYYLEDLDSVLKNNKIDDINIIIKSDTKITSSDLEKIKESGKTVKLNYYNKDKKLEYSWIIDGEKLKNTNDFTTTILNDSENKKDILKLSNYADGLFISLKQTSNLPTGTKIKIFVGNKYEDNDLVNVYTYTNDKEKLDLVANKIKVEDGYIEFSIIESSDYFITMSTISNSDNVVVTTEKEKSSPILTIILSIIILILIGIIVAFILKNKKNNKEDEIYDDETPITSNQEITSSITTTEPSINATSSEAVLNPEPSINTTSSTPTINPEPSINTTSSTPTINPEPSINTTSSEAVLNPEPSNNIQTNINNTGNIENNDDIL